MLFSKSGRSIFPMLPPYGAHVPNGGQGRAAPLHPDGITPYLGLRARLSQVWINRWTILLLLVLARALLAVSGLKSDMASAEREALSACSTVESMGSAMASMPHYLSQGVNELTASGIEDAVNGLMSMLSLTVTGVEEMVVFVLKIMYQTYLCLITLAVRGSVDVAVNLIKDATDFVNKTLDGIGDDISGTVKTFESSLNDFLGVLNSAASAFGGSVPKLDISGSIDKLENLQLPSSIDKSLDNLNSSIPTFDQVQNFTENLIRTPFEEIKKLINQSLTNYTFDRSVLPVPEKTIVRFCNDSDGISSFFDKVADIISTARKIFLAVLLIAAILACIPVAYQEIRRWRSMKERSQLVRKEAHDPMDVVYIVSRPYTAAAGIKAASRFSNSRRQILVRWAIAYGTSMPALFVLSLGIAGLFSCLCQYLLLRSVEKTVPDLTTHVSNFADKVVDKLTNASVVWATDANAVIKSTNTEINDNVFGWVNTSTTALNDTLNAFVDKTTDVLNDTFGGTILYTPLLEVFDCLIGLKIEGIQKGLTWAHDHAHVSFPLLPNDTFSRGAAASVANDSNASSDSFLADAGDATSNKITEVVVRVVNKVEAGIRTEAIIATVIVLIWALVALIGILRALTLFWGRDKPRGEGGGLHNTPSPTHYYPGFTDVPLTAIPVHDSTTTTTTKNDLHSQPVPRYEVTPPKTTINTTTGYREIGGAVHVDDATYEDEKLGFAGQRNYDSALKVDLDGTALRRSNYVEYDSEKMR